MNARAAAAAVRGELSAAGVPDAAFEAELLVRNATGLTRAGFFSDPRVDPAALNAIGVLSDRRVNREPLAYLSGHREFYGLDFMVAPGVLIPRPETELLVEIALREMRDRPGSIVADIGTGSGCVAAAISVNARGSVVTATDRSAEALAVATVNWAALGAAVAAVRCDLAAALGRADVIVANLPYIPTEMLGTLEPEVRDWEPRAALDGGPDGLQLVRRLIDDCGSRLRPRLLALEVMAGQAPNVASYAAAAGARVAAQRDLAGIERVVTARWA